MNATAPVNTLTDATMFGKMIFKVLFNPFVLGFSLQASAKSLFFYLQFEV
jgi:hypothetical protein